MKKVLFAAALAATFGIFADGIESSNIVGYNTLDTGFTYQMLGASFQQVGGTDGVLLKDIQGAFQVYDEIQVSFVDEDGYVQFDVYTYMNEDEGGECEGWHNGDIEYVADSVSIPVGAAVWCISQNNDALALTTSGEVRAMSFTHEGFTEGYSMICSAFPVAFNPNAETVAWDGVALYDEIQVAFVDEDGYVQFDVYTYLNEDEGGEGEGWHNGDIELVKEPIAAVGQGFWLIMYGDPSAVSFTEQSPLAKVEE